MDLPELQRLFNIPVSFDYPDSIVDEVSSTYMCPDALAKGIRFKKVQAAGIKEYLNVRGGFFPIGAGYGKTLLGLTIAHIAHKFYGHKKMMLIVPPELAKQLINDDYPMYKQWVPFCFPRPNPLVGQTKKNRLSWARSGRQGLYLYSYSLLSTPDAEEVMETINPSLIILDEVHKLADNSGHSARRDRFFRFLGNHPNTEVVAMSGTISSKKINDYWRIQFAALKNNSFLPSNRKDVEAWGDILNADSKYIDYPEVPAFFRNGLDQIVNWSEHYGMQIEGNRNHVTNMRKAYRLKMSMTPGVVTTPPESVGSSLIFHNLGAEVPPDYPGMPELLCYLETLDKEYITPSGDTLDNPMLKYKYITELTAGFYYNLYWPSAEELVKHHYIKKASEADVLLERSQVYHEAKQVFNSEMRKFLQYRGRKGLDTPLLIELSLAKHGNERIKCGELYCAWQEMKLLDFEGRVERFRETIRVCDYKIREACLFAKWHVDTFKKGLMLWYHHEAVGTWLHEYMTEMGLKHAYYPSGRKYDDPIKDPKNAKLPVIASSKGHGTGKNLQYHNKMLFVEWPRAAREAEQVIARQHRTGQPEDEVHALTMNKLQYDHILLASTLIDALYLHQTLQSPQRLIYGRYETKPKIFPKQVLIETGIKGNEFDEVIGIAGELFNFS